jgi:Domain of unknown function (DUF4062)
LIGKGSIVLKKKLQVFVSSTFTDMQLERQAAVEAILRAGHIPAGMELFAAGDQSQLKTIHSWIDESDAFILILGGRYGSIEPISGKSYIELEYEYATEKKKPFFATVISDTYLDTKVQELGRSVLETENGLLMKAFKKNVTEKICRFFKDVSDLKLIIIESLSKLENDCSLSGWIKGSDVSHLEIENAQLKAKLTELESRSGFSRIVESEEVSDKNLGEEAKTILLAAKEGGGRILYLKYFGGASIQAGNSSFLTPDMDDREEAKWREAIYELQGKKMIESTGTKGDAFRMTSKGYGVADKIKAKI